MMTIEEPFPGGIRKIWLKNMEKAWRAISFSNDLSPSISQGLDIYTPFGKGFR